MVDLDREKNILRATLHSVRASWKSLLITDLFYKGLAFIVLSPLLSILYRGLISLSGNAVLSDLDIALFLAGPGGLLAAVLVGAVGLSIIALEQASLLAILAAYAVGRPVTTLGAILFALRHSLAVIRVAGRMIAIALLVIAPFLLVSWFIYRSLLTDYDINFYLSHRPLVFQVSLAVGALLVVALSSVLLRFCAGWFLVLPLVLFHSVPPRAALRTSRQRVQGHRWRIFTWILLWIVAGLALNLLVTSLVGALGSWVIPSSVGSLAVLAGRVGLVLALLTVLGMLVNVLCTISFALLLFHGYRQLDSTSQAALLDTNFKSSPLVGRWQLTRSRLLASCTIGVLGAALAGFTALNSLQLDDRTLVMAHRGASQAAPENSLAAIRAAIEARADWVEIDVQETADDQVVVMHDSDFMKLAGNPLKIWDATLEDLQTIDIGSRLDAKFSGERVPTLVDVLNLCRNKIGVVIELKYYGHDRQLEQRVAQIVEQCDMANQVMIMSLKPEAVRKMKNLRPSWSCGLLMSVSIGDIRRVEADFLAVNARAATRNFVNRVHGMGKRVFVWTVNDPASMCTLMNRGVDGLLTDRPELARQLLAQRAEMNSSERLLAEIAILCGAQPVQGTAQNLAQ
jgi:glycerophosphoryl diester phosphodiesterase